MSAELCTWCDQEGASTIGRARFMTADGTPICAQCASLLDDDEVWPLEEPADAPPAIDHTMQCRTCGQRFDMRDLDQVIAHEHGALREATGIRGKLAQPDRPTIMLHERGTCVGVLGADGRLFTHNMDLTPEQARRFQPCTLEQVPGRLRGYLEAARRRAARGVRYGEQG